MRSHLVFDHDLPKKRQTIDGVNGTHVCKQRPLTKGIHAGATTTAADSVSIGVKEKSHWPPRDPHARPCPHATHTQDRGSQNFVVQCMRSQHEHVALRHALRQALRQALRHALRQGKTCDIMRARKETCVSELCIGRYTCIEQT